MKRPLGGVELVLPEGKEIGKLCSFFAAGDFVAVRAAGGKASYK